MLRFCHQIDYATSGMLVFAKSAKAAGDCARLFRERTVSKEYTALVFGWPSWDTTDVDVAIDAHPAGGFRYPNSTIVCALLTLISVVCVGTLLLHFVLIAMLLNERISRFVKQQVAFLATVHPSMHTATLILISCCECC